MKTQKGVITEYDSGLMKRTVKQIRICHDGRAVVPFMNDIEIEVMI